MSSLRARLTISKGRTGNKPEADAALAMQPSQEQNAAVRPFFRALLSPNSRSRAAEPEQEEQGRLPVGLDRAICRNTSVNSSLADNAADSSLEQFNGSSEAGSSREAAAVGLQAVSGQQHYQHQHQASAAGHVVPVSAAPAAVHPEAATAAAAAVAAATALHHPADYLMEQASDEFTDGSSSEDSEQLLPADSDMSDGYGTSEEEEENNSYVESEEVEHDHPAAAAAAAPALAHVGAAAGPASAAGASAAAAAGASGHMGPSSSAFAGVVSHPLRSFSATQHQHQQLLQQLHQQTQQQQRLQQSDSQLQHRSSSSTCAAVAAAEHLLAHQHQQQSLSRHPITPPPSPADPNTLQQQQQQQQQQQGCGLQPPAVVTTTPALSYPLPRRGSTPSGRRGSTPGRWSWAWGVAWLSGDAIGSPKATVLVAATPPPSPAVMP